MSNRIPKTEVNSKQQLGNELFFFALEVAI